MHSEAKNISYSFCFLCLLLALVSLLDFAPPIITRLGLTQAVQAFSGEQLAQVWPYFSLLFWLLLLLLDLRFPSRRPRSASLLSRLSFLLIFESFGLFTRHPLHSFVHVWNSGAKLLLQGYFSVPLTQQDFLPLIIFAFWGPALLLLILPAERFPLLHWQVCFILLAFSSLNIIASLFFRSYTAGLVSSILILPVIFWHMALLLSFAKGINSLGLALLALFYVLLLCFLAFLPNIALFSQSTILRRLGILHIPNVLEVKMLHYTSFFLWFSFPLLFLFVDNNR